MRKRYIIMKILICIIALLGYLQYGREEQAVNTMVSTSDTFYKQEFDVIANKLFNLDKEKYAEELIEKAVENKYRNVRFSYDITGYPNEIVISVYSNEWSYEHKASLSRYDKKTRDTVDEIIGNTIREGRQLGCFCIIAQQQSNASNLSTELKENLPFKLILGMAERQTYITALGVYPDVAKRKFECGQGLLVYPQIATPEMPAVTSIAKLDFDILKAIDCIEEYKNEEKEGQAGVM